jgi:hypothetical protein
VSNDDGLAWIKLDRYALDDLGRGCNLSATDERVLLGLVRHADPRTGLWTGTYYEMSQTFRVRASTLPRVLARFEECVLVEIVRPFGPNRSGVVRVFAYLDLVLSTSKLDAARTEDLRNERDRVIEESANPRPNLALVRTSDDGNLAPTSHQSRTNLAAPSHKCEVAPDLTCDDAEPRGSEGRDEERNELAPRTRGGNCSSCGQPADEGSSLCEACLHAPFDEPEIERAGFSSEYDPTTRDPRRFRQ